MFDGYLQVGGVEVANNERTRGYARSVDCPLSFKDVPCDTLETALAALATEAGEPVSAPYTYDSITESPWYDSTVPDESSRFLGVFVTSMKGFYSSTRSAEVTETIGDGGNVGLQRRTTREVRVQAILLARGQDALEYGMRWLDAALDPAACGRHAESCGTTDMLYLTACPPAVEEFQTGVYTPVPDVETWELRETNLTTNPSFEAASSTVEVRRNRAINSRPSTGWLFNGTGAGTITYTNGSGSFYGIPSEYGRLTYTTLATGLPGNGVRSPLATLPVGAHALSIWVRTSVAQAMKIEIGGGTAVATVTTAPTVTTIANTWVRLTAVINVTTAGTLELRASSATGGHAWTVGETLDFTGALIETGGVVLPYFDGATANGPKVRRNYATNPSFDSSPTTGWSLFFSPGRALDPDDYRSAPNSVRLMRGSGSSQGIYTNGHIANPGDVLYGSGWVKAPLGQQYRLAFKNSAGSGGGGATVFTGTGQWEFREITYTVPAVPASNYQFMFVVDEAMMGSMPVGEPFLWVDDVLYEVNPPSLGLPYFDGDTPLPGYLAAWESTANASASFLYDADFTNAFTAGGNASDSVLNAVGAPGIIAPSATQVTLYSTGQTPALGAKAARFRILTTGAVGIPVVSVAAVTGTTYTLIGKVRPQNRDQVFQPRVRGALGPAFTAPKGVWTEFRITVPAGSGSTNGTGLLISGGSGHQYGDLIDVDDVLLVEGDYTGPTFNGTTTDTASDRYGWTAATDASTSTHEHLVITPQPPLFTPDFPDPEAAWLDALEGHLRYLHGVGTVSGPNEGDEVDLGNDFWMLEVEFVLVAGRPFVYSVTKPVVLPITPSTVVDDIPKNLIPYPSAELSAAVAVVVARNYAPNPSVETNATDWSTSGDGVVILNAQLAGARDTGLAAVGAASYRSVFTAAAASAVPGSYRIDLTVPLPHISVAGERYSLNMWSSKSTAAGAPVYGTHEVHAIWRNAALATLRDDLVGAVPAAGGAVSLKSIEPPVGATSVLMRANLNLASWNAGTIVRLYADATAVSVP